ncbi:hypothetical protein J6590_064173 [Homalodisca vitripennis]|nr:hypothetical protein J6590_064173 [Homalodisca vitripennis]
MGEGRYRPGEREIEQTGTHGIREYCCEHRLFKSERSQGRPKGWANGVVTPGAAAKGAPRRG